MKINTTIFKTGLFALAGFCTAGVFAQNKPVKQFGRDFTNQSVTCATTQYEELLQQKFPNRATTQQFEE